MDLNKKVILKLLGVESPLKLSELKSRFVERMNITLKLSNKTVDNEITELYVDGYISKNEGANGYFLTAKGKKVFEKFY